MVNKLRLNCRLCRKAKSCNQKDMIEAYTVYCCIVVYTHVASCFETKMAAVLSFCVYFYCLGAYCSGQVFSYYDQIKCEYIVLIHIKSHLVCLILYTIYRLYIVQSIKQTRCDSICISTLGRNLGLICSSIEIMGLYTYILTFITLLTPQGFPLQ